MLASLLSLLLLLPGASLASEGEAPSPPLVEPVEDPHQDWTPEEWIQEVDRRAEALPGLRYSARRITRTPSREGEEIELQERWRFILLEPDHFRIDYFGDTARQITCDGEHLVDYVPANGKAIRHHLPSMKPDARAELLALILEKVALPGWRLGQARDVSWRFGEPTTRHGRQVVVLEGEGEGGTLHYEIDAERVAVLRTEIHSGGQVVLRTDSSEHREILPGTWVPHEVQLRAPDKGGEVRVTLHLTKVSVVTDSPDDLFQTTLDPSIPVEDRP